MGGCLIRAFGSGFGSGVVFCFAIWLDLWRLRGGGFNGDGKMNDCDAGWIMI